MLVVVFAKSLDSGLGGDFKVLKSSIRNCIYHTDHKNDDKVYAKILLEHIRPEWLKVKSDFTYFIPNIEMLTDWDVDLMRQVDLTLCKNALTYNLLSGPRLLTKFTSIPGKKSDSNYDLVVHFAGTSYMKGTDLVIKYWLENEGFLHLNPNIKLLITVRTSKKWASLKPKPVKKTSFMGRPVRGEEYKNIFRVEHLDAKDFEYFSSTAGMRLQPSIAEGFSHVINESRAMGTLCITTNAPPFNELITEPECLIEPEYSIPSYEIFKEYKNLYTYIYRGQARAYFIGATSFTRIMENIIRMPEPAKRQLAAAQHRRYQQDREFYIKALSTIL